jgi:glycosyltransferase involved in cell wall biosynthesis
MATPIEIWSPLPPDASGVADYVEEQLPFLPEPGGITLVTESPEGVVSSLRERYAVVSPSASDANAVRVYHIGNSPAHAFAYREAIARPGIVFLHEWNLHELLLGLAVTSNDFRAYRDQMRREHGERGTIAAGAIADALGGRHWTSVFPLNAELLERALAVVCLARSTAAKAAARLPGVPVLHLPHHAVLRSHASTREEARTRLNLDPGAPIILAPGLGTASKALDTAREALEQVRQRWPEASLMTVGGEARDDGRARVHHLGRVDIETLGDALVAADVVLALRFPSRGETSGVLMRALAAGRATVVSSGSTADEDLARGVVARVSPGPYEVGELAALIELLLGNADARERMERLAFVEAGRRDARELTKSFAGFVDSVAAQRAELMNQVSTRSGRRRAGAGRWAADIEGAVSSLGLARAPQGVFEKLEGLL